jgi:hypothetical protein
MIQNEIPPRKRSRTTALKRKKIGDCSPLPRPWTVERLEMRIEKLKAQTTTQLSELGKKTDVKLVYFRRHPKGFSHSRSEARSWSLT